MLLRLARVNYRAECGVGRSRLNIDTKSELAFRPTGGPGWRHYKPVASVYCGAVPRGDVDNGGWPGVGAPQYRDAGLRDPGKTAPTELTLVAGCYCEA